MYEDNTFPNREIAMLILRSFAAAGLIIIVHQPGTMHPAIAIQHVGEVHVITPLSQKKK